MNYPVLIDREAERDLEVIHEYLVQRAGLRAADRLLDQILAKTERLESNPHRGSFVNEIEALVPQTFRQLYWQPWRIIYFVRDDYVAVVLVADGRRNRNTLLTERLVQPGLAKWSG